MLKVLLFALAVQATIVWFGVRHGLSRQRDETGPLAWFSLWLLASAATLVLGAIALSTTLFDHRLTSCGFFAICLGEFATFCFGAGAGALTEKADRRMSTPRQQRVKD